MLHMRLVYIIIMEAAFTNTKAGLTALTGQRARLSRAGLAQQLLLRGLTHTILAYTEGVTVVSLETADRDTPNQLATAYQDAVLIVTRMHLLVLHADMQLLAELPLQGDLLQPSFTHASCSVLSY